TLPCVSHVFDERVKFSPTKRTAAGGPANTSVAGVPSPCSTVPAENERHAPLAGSLIGSGPVQYCTVNVVAYGCAQRMRMALTARFAPRSTMAHCGFALSGSPVNACVR